MSRIQEIKNRLNKQAAQTKEARRRDFQDFRDHPLLYIALIVSGFLSGLAGIAIGLGVQVQDGNVIARFDFVHLFFAGIYATLFPTFFEYGLANWLHKLLHREPENKTQYYTSLVMVVMTFIGTAITAFAAMDVLVTGLGFFDSFQQIPAGVQRWIAFSLPAMFMLNVAAGEVYRQFSAAAVLRREAEMELREKQIEADNEVRLAQMDAEKNIAIKAAEEYSRRATQEADKLGSQKGGDRWNQDRVKHGAEPVQPLAAPVVSLAAETEQPKLDPTQASPSGKK